MIDLKSLNRRVGVVLGVCLVFFVVMAIGFRLRAGGEFKAGRDAEAKGETAQAIAHYDRAVRAHYPFSSVGKQARDRLLEIAMTFEKEGRLADAHDARQILLSALCAVETGLSGNRDLIDSLEADVARLFEASQDDDASSIDDVATTQSTR